LVGQYTRDQTYLQCSGDDVEDHRGQKEAYSFRTTIDGSRQATSLAGEVKVQIELHKVLEDVAGDLANGLL
jgi:hypothetical protein